MSNITVQEQVESGAGARWLTDEAPEGLINLHDLERPVIPSLLGRVNDALGGAVALIGPDMVVLATVGNPEDVRVGRTAGDCERELVAELCGVRRSVLLPARGKRPARRLAAIRCQEELLGYLCVAGQTTTAPPADCVVHAAGLLCAVLLERADCQGDAHGRRQELLADIAAGRRPEETLDRGARLGCGLHETSHAVAFGLVEESDAVVVQAVLDAVELRLRRAGAVMNLHGVVGGEDVLVLLDEVTHPCPRAFADAVVAALLSVGVAVSAGIGPCADTSEQLTRTSERARRALQVLRTTKRSGQVARYDELGAYVLLVRDADPGLLVDFVDSTLGPLLRYDLDHRAELTSTLECLLSQPTIAKAAEVLFLHLSTLKYRIKRIEDILSVDLHEPTTLFDLGLAVRLHRVAHGCPQRVEEPLSLAL